MKSWGAQARYWCQEADNPANSWSKSKEVTDNLELLKYWKILYFYKISVA